MSFVNTRVPINQVELSSKFGAEGINALNYKTLVFAQALDTGTIVAGDLNTPKLFSSESSVRAFSGAGSQAHLIAKSYFKNNVTNELWIIFTSIDDPTSSSNKAVGDITFSGTATEAGNLQIYIGNNKLTVPVASGDAADDVKDSVVALIASEGADYAAIGADGGVGIVDITAKNVGEEGLDITVDVNRYDGDNEVAGITYVLSLIHI